MTNEDIKDRFQVSLARFYNRSDQGKLIDIGCGPGRFLYHVKRYIPNHLGIEITPECLKFAREQMEVSVSDHLTDEEVKKAKVVTLWHSLEHFPENDLKNLMERLQQSLPNDATVIVSVPNVESLHWTIFGSRSTYYDIVNHPHQFSTTSLVKLFGKYGFSVKEAHVSVGYSFLGAVLSALNWVGPHNLLYRSLRRGELKLQVRQLLGYGILASLFSVPAGLLYLYEKAFPKQAGVLTLAFSKA